MFCRSGAILGNALLLASACVATLIATARPAVADHHPIEDRAPDFAASCNDGQTSGGSNACDLDGKPDGYCTFGKAGEKQFRVAVGQSKKVENSCHVVGQFSCDPPLETPPKIIDVGEAGAKARGKGLPTIVSQSGATGSMKGSCRYDAECVPTYKNGCVMRDRLKDWQDPGNSRVSCRCLKGPTTFGCIPYDRMGNRLNP